MSAMYLGTAPETGRPACSTASGLPRRKKSARPLRGCTSTKREPSAVHSRVCPPTSPSFALSFR
eukprot:3366133-Rhodomonas_salina.2